MLALVSALMGFAPFQEGGLGQQGCSRDPVRCRVVKRLQGR